MKHKVNILIPIFILLVLVYAIRSIFGPHLRTEALRRGTLENVISTKGLMIKYETVINPENAGSMESLVQEGERVAAGQAVMAVYSGQVDADVKNRLERINKKITQIEKSQADLLAFSSDISHLEQKITEETASLVEQSLAGNMLSVNESKLALGALCEKKAQIAGDGASDGILEELKAQKAQLEAQTGAASTYLTAPNAGVFSTTIDGVESVITPYNMMELVPSKTQELLEQDQDKKEESQETVACKIVQNFRYFVAVNLPAEQGKTMSIGDGVNLRFYDLSSDLIPMTVLYISPEEDEQITVIVEGNRYLDTLLKRRTVNIDFIQHRYSGYYVNLKCLETKDDVTGVYVLREDVPKFIPVTVLYNTKDTAIIKSASTDNPLRLHDEVIVNADRYEEGDLQR